MAESKIRDDNFYLIGGWMINRLGLKGTALQIFAIIYGFSQDGEGEFKGSLRYLCDFTGASKNTVIKALKDLADRGYILKTESQLNGVKLCTYRSAPGVQNLNRGGAETAPGLCRNCTEGGAETAPNNKRDNKEDNIEDKEESPPAQETGFGSDLQAAFDDWLRYKAERKDSYTPTGLNNLISEIRNNAAKHGEGAVAALIRKCIASGWKGIIFEKLEEQPRGGRREPVPNWAKSDRDEMRKYVQNMKKKTTGTDAELAERAQALREKLKGDSNAGI